MDPNEQNQQPVQASQPLPPEPAATVPQQNPAAPPAPQPAPQTAVPAPQPMPQTQPPQVGVGTPTPAPVPAPLPGQQVAAAPQPGVTDARANTNPNSTQNTLLIAEVRDGVVIMNDGSFRSVIMTKSINFDLMSPEERESVEFAYQGFLNSLYYPIQIFIRSQKVDIRPYIEKLDRLRVEQENMLLALMMEDYIQFIDLLAQETNVMDKQFYIVVPYFQEVNAQKATEEGKKLFKGLFGKGANQPQAKLVINEADLEKAKGELRNRVGSVMSGLQQVGVQSVPLDTEELIELYYDSYNPDTATRQKIKNFNDLTAPIVGKGVGEAPQPNLDREQF